MRFSKAAIVVAMVSLLAPPALVSADATPPPGADVQFLALNDEIREFLIDRVPAKAGASHRLRALLDAIFRDDGLAIAYGNTRTKTAIETFETRSGNCLSFTILFIGMAREVGLAANFIEVGEVLSWSRRGNIVVNNRHMFSEVELAHSYKVPVDFLPGTTRHYRQVRRIDDRRALAHFYNNLGAEQLEVAQYEKAIEYFEKAVQTDPEFSYAWSSLGVTYRRLGEFETSEKNHLKALEINPRDASAASNLASLYFSWGKQDKAERYARKVRGYRKRNPFYHFKLGINSTIQGNLPDAIRHVKRAVQRQPDDPEFRAVLAELYRRNGQSGKAIRHLRRAIRFAEEEEYRGRLESLLEALEIAQSAPAQTSEDS